VLSSSDFLPLSTLCIHPGKAVWVLYVDATCINYNGNAFDAALLAMVAALRNSAHVFRARLSMMLIPTLSSDAAASNV
jgi:exosome complex RNA-binding protein Rrp42 (RNase PH superfamily)